MLKKFTGTLRWVNPNRVVSKELPSEIENLFLKMAVIFNDLQGLLVLVRLFQDSYEPPTGEPTVHTGFYAGISVQLNKLIAATIHEFFEFLKNNKETLQEREFLSVLSDIPQQDQVLWHGIIAASEGKLNDVADYLKAIVQIRSNLAYHYDEFGKVFRRGFLSRFMGGYKESKNEEAYYSLGSSLIETRFFFADAAVEEAMYLNAGKDYGVNSKNSSELAKFSEITRQSIDAIGSVLGALLKSFLKQRKY
jgi:hypothetical protein